jgi:hypothetical protein
MKRALLCAVALGGLAACDDPLQPGRGAAKRSPAASVTAAANLEEVDVETVHNEGVGWFKEVDVKTVHDEGVGWFVTLNHGQCRIIPPKLGDISPVNRAPTEPLGDRLALIVTKVMADGSRRIEITDVVTGIAEDSNGDRYIWIYENRPIYHVPPGADPVRVYVRMFDRVRLIGNGFKMDVGFDWRWGFRVPSGRRFDPGPEAAEVVFPEDRVNPTNVFDFKAFSTRGNPLACDPL